MPFRINSVPLLQGLRHLTGGQKGRHLHCNNAVCFHHFDNHFQYFGDLARGSLEHECKVGDCLSPNVSSCPIRTGRRHILCILHIEECHLVRTRRRPLSIVVAIFGIPSLGDYISLNTGGLSDSFEYLAWNLVYVGCCVDDCNVKAIG